MARYQMQAPDLNTYEIDGPEGASDDQVRQEITRQNPHLARIPAGAVPGSPGTKPGTPDWALPFSGQPETTLPQAAGKLINAGTATASAGLGAVPGALLRTGGAAVAGGVEGGQAGAIKGGTLNAVIESMLPGAGALIRNTPILKGFLARRLAREAEEATVKNAATFKGTEAANKSAAESAADETNAGNVQQWMLKKRGISEGNDALNRSWGASKSIAKQEAEKASAANAEEAGTRLRGTIEKEVPTSGVAADRPKSLQDFAWGEHGMDATRQAMDAGQNDIVKLLAKAPPSAGLPQKIQRPVGQIVDVPTRPWAPAPPQTNKGPLLVIDGNEMSFPDAWRMAGQLKGQQRDHYFNNIQEELRRLDPSGAALTRFTDMRKQFAIAVNARSMARQGVEPSGGEATPETLGNWFNRRRDYLAGRLGDKYQTFADSVFGAKGPGSAVNTTVEPQVIPKPSFRNVAEAGPKPVPVESSYVPGTPPAPVQPGGTLAEPGLLDFLARRIPGMRWTGMGGRWTGPNVPFTPSPTARTFSDVLLQRAADRENHPQ